MTSRYGCSPQTTHSSATLSAVQLSAGPWEVTATDRVRIYHYRSPASQDAATRYAGIASDLVAFFDRHYGAGLPEQAFYFAEMDIRGGISAGNVAALPSDGFRRILEPDREFATCDWMGHEIVHQYVMPAIVPESPGAAIMVEPFPLYFHLPALKKRFGRSFERWFLRRRWEAYEKGLDSQSPGSEFPVNKPLVEISLDEISDYKDRFLLSDKAVIALHRLGKLVGEAVFLRAVSRFLESHRTSPATLDDFERVVSEESGMSLREFFKRWFGTIEALPSEWRTEDLAGE